jgi:hypothetical protein
LTTGQNRVVLFLLNVLFYLFAYHPPSKRSMIHYVSIP